MTTPRSAEPPHPTAASPPRFLGWERLALLLSGAIGALFFARTAGLSLAYDDYDYAMAARSILDGGLFSKFYGSEIRTYGYPLFVSAAERLSALTGAPLRGILFSLQLPLFLLAAAFLRRELCHRNSALGRVVFCAIVLNIYAVMFAAEVLTESLSASLLLATAASWLRLQRLPRALLPLCLGASAAAAAVMIRPANLFLLATWLVGCAVILGPLLVRTQDRAAGAARLVLVAVITSAIFLPQWINNTRHWQRQTPLTAVDLQRTQQQLGIANLKYATALPPQPQPEVFTRNPLAAGTRIDPEQPLRWYLDHPLRGTLTLALHIFNMTDQDLLFTYARDLDPWFRVPLGLATHALVALGLFGFVLLWRNARARGSRPELEAAGMLTMLMLANCAVYATTAVEMRFGITLLIVLFACAAFALRSMRGARPRIAAFTAAGAAAYAVGAMILSGWVRSHAALIAP